MPTLASNISIRASPVSTTALTPATVTGIDPGDRWVTVELPGYRTFETDVNVLVGQKSEMKTELVKGSIEQAGTEIKKP